jgi:hypothetical protein
MSRHKGAGHFIDRSGDLVNHRVMRALRRQEMGERKPTGILDQTGRLIATSRRCVRKIPIPELN